MKKSRQSVFRSRLRSVKRVRSAKRLFARSRPSLRVLRTHRAVRLPRFVTLNPLRARLVRRDKLFTLGHTLFLNLGLVIHRFVVLDVAPARAIDRSIVPSSRRQSPLSRASRRGRPPLPPDAFPPEPSSRLSRRVSASPHAHLRRPSVRQTVKSRARTGRSGRSPKAFAVVTPSARFGTPRRATGPKTRRRTRSNDRTRTFTHAPDARNARTNRRKRYRRSKTKEGDRTTANCVRERGSREAKDRIDNRRER